MTWTHQQSWTLDHPPERVFAAFISSGALESWFAASAEVEPVPGGAYRFWGRQTLGMPTSSEATQSILAIEPGRELRFSWRIGACPTEVSLSFAPEGSGCRLGISHRVDGDLGGSRQKELIDDHWRLAVGNLMGHLSGGTGMLRPDYGDRTPEIRMEIEIEAPPELVFRALIEPEALKQWIGGDPVVDPRLGGAVDFGWRYEIDGRAVRGGPTRILEFDPPRRITFDWPDYRGDPSVEGQTISFDLEPTSHGTRVRFRHAGFVRPADLSDYPFGWTWFLSQLRQSVQSSH